MAGEQSFDSFIEGIQHACHNAVRGMQDQHLELFDRYFEKELDDQGAETGHLRPKIVTLMMPSTSSHKEDDYEIQVPLFTLVPLRSIVIEQLKVEFEVRINAAKDDVDRKQRPRNFLMVDTGGWNLFGKGGKHAKVEVIFKGADPPEGVVRLNNQVVKTLPT
jgi:hypothetical protein